MNLCWDEFYDRLINDKEEFCFFKDNNKIEISFGYINDVYVLALAYGNDLTGYIRKYYIEPQDFLNDKIFEGKTLKEIWDELE